MSSAPDDKPPYARYAFLNAYNLSVMGGAVAAAAATQNWWLAVVAAGVEGLWMLFAPDSRLLQRAWFDRYHRAERDKARDAERDAKLASLPQRDAERFAILRGTRDHILLLAKDNPAFTQDLLGSELTKLDHLVDAFLDLAVTCARYSQYLHSIDLGQIERDAARFEKQVERDDDPNRRALAQKNLAILLKRRDTYGEIARDLQVTRSQLDLIENTLKLLADQIVTMRTPSELAGQLDDLITGVETARRTARETERFMTSIER